MPASRARAQACDRAGVRIETHIGDVTAGTADMEMAELGRTAAVALHAQRCRATGYVAMNDMLAIGLMAGLRQCGLRIPEDVSVVGVDDLFLGQYISPTLSTVRQPMRDMATAAVERVLARMKKPGEAPHELVFVPELVVRESTAPSGVVKQPRSQQA